MSTRRQFVANCSATAGGVSRIQWFTSPVFLGSAEKGTVKIIHYSDSGEKMGPALVKKVHNTDTEWKRLTARQFEVTRKEGTERAFRGEYFNLYDRGLYRCICRGNALCSSDTKFESGTGLSPW